MEKYWLTPPEIYKKLDDEFHFDFDPCPCPRPEGYNSLLVPWGDTSYVNPPFRQRDAYQCSGPTAFVHKAIEENKQGKTVVLMLPTQSYVNRLLEAGAEARSFGRVRWLDVDTGAPWKSPGTITCFVLRGDE